MKGHAPNCAMHNMPGYPTAPCNCGYDAWIKSGVVTDEDREWAAAEIEKIERDNPGVHPLPRRSK